MLNFVKVITMLKLFFYRTMELFSGKNKKKKDIEVECGELFVTGKDNVEIDLPILPRAIEVKFKHREHHIPCNPHHHKLSWEVCKHHHQYKLIIKWDVSDLSEIIWVAYF